MKKNIALFSLVIIISAFQYSFAREFIHPGIDQNAGDMEYMKRQVLSGAQPWKDAFEKMVSGIDLYAPVKPFAHVQRGPYGKPNIGGGELSRNAGLAYDCTLAWYITGKKEYAEKAVIILNAWSDVLSDFDYNDAKLLAGWTGYILCNAAEILRSYHAEWKQQDIEKFRRMLMTVYYPLLRFYYPEANGNWDGAIIHSVLAIAIFTDNGEMYENAVDHFLHGPVNGSVFKYIYPSGQCQETMRDQGHVQLGLGEFAGAARVAWTQGTDLFSPGNHRIALGFEYTAGFLLGETPQSYGIISDRSKNLRDDYEYIYRHYEAQGITLNFTKAAADSVRYRSSRNTLTAFRMPGSMKKLSTPPEASRIAYPSGATGKADAPEGSLKVEPGQSLQEALNIAAGTGKWVVAETGIHTIKETMTIPSGTILAGMGRGTIIHIDPSSGVRDAIVNSGKEMHDVTIRDLVIEGNPSTDRGSDPNVTRSYRSNANRGGIMFLAERKGDLKNITLTNVTVRNCTYNGVFINGAEGIEINGCDFDENGSKVVPGPRLQHNLLITGSSNITINNSRTDTSPYGCGIALSKCSDAGISGCEVARNGYYGILVSECSSVRVSGCLVEANDRSGIMAEYLFDGCSNIEIKENILRFNNGYGFEAYAVKNLTSIKNYFSGNAADKPKISSDKFIIMK